MFKREEKNASYYWLFLGMILGAKRWCFKDGICFTPDSKHTNKVWNSAHTNSYYVGQVRPPSAQWDRAISIFPAKTHFAATLAGVSSDWIIPAATATGRCVPPSKHWPCLVCPAGPFRAPRWTCPCWQSGRYWKLWSGSPGCGRISFPLAQNSLGTTNKNYKYTY